MATAKSTYWSRLPEELRQSGHYWETEMGHYKQRLDQVPDLAGHITEISPANPDPIIGLPDISEEPDPPPIVTELMVTLINLTPGSVDNPNYFVHQHYLDFLHREPDTRGFAFWSNQITSCGADQHCIELNRINVSAAFYLSTEFQQTGYLV